MLFNKKIKLFAFVCFFFFNYFCLFAQNTQNLIISPNDLFLEPQRNGNEVVGFHLYIKKKDGLNSVLLCETTKDPDGKSNNYAYRALEYNSINGDEIRFLDGKPLVSEGAKYSLIDSTSEFHSVLGEVFHIYIPVTVQFGYAWTRNEIVDLKKGTFINIRAFEKPYADYNGSFRDNPYLFDVRQFFVQEEIETPLPPPAEEVSPPEIETPLPPPTEEVLPPATETIVQEPSQEEPKNEIPDEVLSKSGYNLLANDAFKKIANPVSYSSGPETLIEDIRIALSDLKNEEKAEVVFVIDTTGSMRNDMSKLKNSLVPSLIKQFESFAEVRFGLIFYRDYGEDYNFQGLPIRYYAFTPKWGELQQNINRIIIEGGEGGDIPEAVYEALYGSLAFYDWSDDAQKKVILIGDAEPHPTPRESGLYTKELVMSLAEEKKVQIQAILLPQK